MSGIYISGMEMPKSCADCFAERCIGSDFGCDILGFDDVNTTCFTRERRKDCPLISVPDHGRLIDADALKEASHYDDHDVCVVDADDIDNAPTIIPAEEGE